MAFSEYESNESAPLEESSKHRITTVIYDCPFAPPTEMYKLHIFSGEHWLSFRRERFSPHGLEGLQELAENYSLEQGFFCTHGVGHPMKEFTELRRTRDPDQRRLFPEVYVDLEPLPLEPFTFFVPETWGWSFGGNHRNYSGAFGYKIFDEALAKQVYNELFLKGVRAEPNEMHPREYPIQLS